MSDIFPFDLRSLGLSTEQQQALESLAQERDKWFLITRTEFVLHCGLQAGKELADSAHSYRQSKTNTWYDPFYDECPQRTEGDNTHYQRLLEQHERVSYLNH